MTDIDPTSDDPTSDEPAEYGLVMPFVVCEDQGGPYNAAAFVAGYECGNIDATLRVAAQVGVVIERWVTPDLIPQLDLIAMKHNQRLVVGGESDDGEWRNVRIGHPLLVAPDDAGGAS